METMAMGLVCSWIVIVVLFFLWRTSEADKRYHRREADRYFDKWLEIRASICEVHQCDEPDEDDDDGDCENWWRKGGSPYGEAS